MLNYFRINDLSRLITLAVILLLIRLPFYIYGDVVTQSDIRYFLLGEKIASGSWLYADIYTSESLLSGLFFGIIVGLFGKSIVVFHIIAFLLTLLQVYILNELVTVNRATANQTYFPGLFYALFISLFPGAFTLSPFLIGQTFLLIAMNYQFNHLEFRVKRDEKIILIGILISLYSLFTGAAMFYLFTAYLIFILYTNTLLRRYLLIAVGFLIPYLLIWGIFEISGYGGMFFSRLPGLLESGWSAEEGFLYFSILPLFFLLIFLPQALFGGRFTNYQSTLNFAVLLWALSSIVVFFLSYESVFKGFILLAPLFALYASHYFMHKSRGIVFFFMVIAVISTNIFFWVRPEFMITYLGEKQEINPRRELEGKSVLVMEEDFTIYPVSSSHSSMFFDWNSSKQFFEGELSYEKLRQVYLGFKGDFPDVIVDKNNLLERYFEHIPELEGMYRRRGDSWIRISS